MLKLKGDAELLRNIKVLQNEVPRRLLSRLEDLTLSWHSDTLDRITYPFQSVPSYVWESIWGIPGRKQYPKGQKGFFSTESPSIEGTQWKGIVQEYANGPHRIASKLDVEASIDGDTVVAGIGYKQGEENTETGRKIKMILFGTTKMQPRNFLRDSLDRFENQFVEAAAQAVEEAILSPEIT